MYTKISDSEMEISETKTITNSRKYTLQYLLEWKKAIEEQRTEVDALIAEAKKLGLKLPA